MALWIGFIVLISAWRSIDEVRDNLEFNNLSLSNALTTSEIAYDLIFIVLHMVMVLMVDDFVGNTIYRINYYNNAKAKKLVDDDSSSSLDGPPPPLPPQLFWLWMGYVPVPCKPSWRMFWNIVDFFFQFKDAKTHEALILILLSSAISLFVGCLLGQNSELISSFLTAVLLVSDEL